MYLCIALNLDNPALLSMVHLIRLGVPNSILSIDTVTVGLHRFCLVVY